MQVPQAVDPGVGFKPPIPQGGLLQLWYPSCLWVAVLGVWVLNKSHLHLSYHLQVIFFLYIFSCVWSVLLVFSSFSQIVVLYVVVDFGVDFDRRRLAQGLRTPPSWSYPWILFLFTSCHFIFKNSTFYVIYCRSSGFLFFFSLKLVVVASFISFICRFLVESVSPMLCGLWCSGLFF